MEVFSELPDRSNSGGFLEMQCWGELQVIVFSPVARKATGFQGY